jgi:hypothetical protein
MKKSFLCLYVYCAALVSVRLLALEIGENSYKPFSPQAFPAGCDNAFSEISKFRDFFQNTISIMAAERGASAKGVSDLFAVAELSQHLLDVAPNLTEESPIDRLVKSQLCRLEEVYNNEKKAPLQKRQALNSDDTLLHDHMVKVAHKLFLDSYKIVEEVVMAKAKEKQKERLMQNKSQEVEKARRMGRDKIEKLF